MVVIMLRDILLDIIMMGSGKWNNLVDSDLRIPPKKMFAAVKTRKLTPFPFLTHTLLSNEFTLNVQIIHE